VRRLAIKKGDEACRGREHVSASTLGRASAVIKHWGASGKTWFSPINLNCWGGISAWVLSTRIDRSGDLDLGSSIEEGAKRAFILKDFLPGIIGSERWFHLGKSRGRANLRDEARCLSEKPGGEKRYLQPAKKSL